MSVKKMVQLYLSFGLDEETWHMLWQMTNHGLISSDKWSKFCEICCDWHLDDETGEHVVDGEGNLVSLDRYLK